VPEYDETAQTDDTEVTSAVAVTDEPTLATAHADDEFDPAAELRQKLRFAPGDWYVVHSYAGYENKVKTNLETRITSLDMEEYIFQVEVPTEEVTEIKNASASRSSARCCPGTSSCAWT
jgi:transcriptional antiterminator NusG